VVVVAVEVVVVVVVVRKGGRWCDWILKMQLLHA
jgi:hypothetical protein